MLLLVLLIAAQQATVWEVQLVTAIVTVLAHFLEIAALILIKFAHVSPLLIFKYFIQFIAMIIIVFSLFEWYSRNFTEITKQPVNIE